MLVDGQPLNLSFQRKTGYVQQQDLHLSTATVREALVFSALLRQPATTPRESKIDYIEEVLDLLDMTEYADAIIGETGQGLNVEQRKRLTIGVELAAKPELLVFLDEPTSGLDSQTSWSICDLMRKLVDRGHAILCTIHQPSTMLFQRFDRLLLLARGGRTVYFGEVGQGSQVLRDYFVRNGAHECPPGANPAEWMLGVIGAAPGATSAVDWHQVWKNSPEKQAVDRELTFLTQRSRRTDDNSDVKGGDEQYAAGLGTQIAVVTKRSFQHYWRSPSYLYSKAFLGVGSVNLMIHSGDCALILYRCFSSALLFCKVTGLNRVYEASCSAYLRC
jgi:ATP-binding cassette, subfamily G (WHITE), member 2, PDR